MKKIQPESFKLYAVYAIVILIAFTSYAYILGFLGGENLNAEKIGKRLKRLRGKRTLRAISEDLQISDSALCAYELGKRIPRDDKKKIIAKYYGKSIEELFYKD